MDPNATLKRIRELTDPELIGSLTPDEAEELRTLVSALDEWISKGGFFPRAWMPF